MDDNQIWIEVYLFWLKRKVVRWGKVFVYDYAGYMKQSNSYYFKFYEWIFLKQKWLINLYKCWFFELTYLYLKKFNILAG